MGLFKVLEGVITQVSGHTLLGDTTPKLQEQ